MLHVRSLGMHSTGFKIRTWTRGALLSKAITPVPNMLDALTKAHPFDAPPYRHDPPSKDILSKKCAKARNEMIPAVNFL